MRIAILDLIITCRSATLTTGKPRDTESGHAWFGGEGLEKRRDFSRAARWPLTRRSCVVWWGGVGKALCFLTSGSLASYPTARSVRRGEGCGNAPFLPGHILIDSPPSLGFFSFCALNAATEAIIPLQPQPFAYRMVAPTMELIELVSKSSSGLTVRAIVLTMYDRRVSLTESIEEVARQTYSDLVAKTVIPTNIAVSEATLDGIPVALYNAGSAGTQAYKALCEELYG